MIYKEDCYFFPFPLFICSGKGANIFSFLFICPVVVGFPVERVVFPGALEHYLLNWIFQSTNKYLLSTYYVPGIVELQW